MDSDFTINFLSSIQNIIDNINNEPELIKIIESDFYTDDKLHYDAFLLILLEEQLKKHKNKLYTLLKKRN